MSLAFFTPVQYSHINPVRQYWLAPQRRCNSFHPRCQGASNCGPLGISQLQNYRYGPHYRVRRPTAVHSDAKRQSGMEELVDALFGILQDPNTDSRHKKDSSAKQEIVIPTKGNNEQSVDKFQLHFNMGGFKPDEIRVKTKDEKYLEVHAKHVEESESGQVFRHFHRIVKIPDSADAASLKSALSPEGILRIEAPLKEKTIDGPESKEIMEALDKTDETVKMNDDDQVKHEDCKSGNDETVEPTPDCDETSARNAEITPEGGVSSEQELTTNSDSLMMDNSDVLLEEGGVEAEGISREVITAESPDDRADDAKPTRMISNSQEVNTETTSTFQLHFDLHEFKESEVKVNTKDDRLLEIEAEHEEKSEYGQIYKKYHQLVQIPEHVNISSLKSGMSRGVLCIEAPKEQDAVLEMEVAHE